MEVIREVKYTSSTIILGLDTDNDVNFYWVLIIEEETEDYPEFVERIGFEDLVDAAIYYGKLQGQFITEM